MQPFKLAEPALVAGRDYFGRKAEIIFSPTHPHKPGFSWKFHSEKPAVHISANLASTRSRQISLTHEGAILNVYEHIGVLRYTGLDGVEIVSPNWPPFHGRPLELYDAILEKAVMCEEPLRWFTIYKKIRIDYSSKAKRYTALYPGDQPKLKIIIYCDYPGLGEMRLCYFLPQDAGVLLSAFSCHAQGWPKWTYHPAKLAGFLGWPHATSHIDWPQEYGQDTLRRFCHHRLVDLLGGLSLLHPTRLFAGTVVSHCSGHWADVAVSKEAQHVIKCLNV